MVLSKFNAAIIGCFWLIFLLNIQAQEAKSSLEPITSADTVFVEEDGFVAVEAEHFFNQTLTDVRAFHITTEKQTPEAESDGDPNHVLNASNGAYIEALPDTRRNHGEKLIGGENFSNVPGKLAIVDYKVRIQNPGRYYVWVRAFSTGTEDNGIHVGLNGEWPEHGQRLQWTDGKNTWFWDSKQRTAEVHSGVPGQIWLDIEEAGVHTVSFSMREDGFEFDKFIMTRNRKFQRPDGLAQTSKFEGPEPPKFKTIERDLTTSPTTPVSKLPLIEPRQADGDGAVSVTGELKAWHKVTLTMDGPYAHEKDNEPNPFLDYVFVVDFLHEESGTTYQVPGYFAADGDAANTSAESGTKWRAHFAPDREGEWSYVAKLWKAHQVAINPLPFSDELFHAEGKIKIEPTDKTGRDFRGQGRLQYVGERYLKFAGSGKYFLKAGADAPETLFGYADFDGTVAGKKKSVPLKKFEPHLQDWNNGDPIWKDGKGKGLIGAINYLSGKGCNAFSFLTYNAGGDGDNVWPFIQRNDKLHYDCSKLDQWGVVLDHGTKRGMYLHFKLQETEVDDHIRGTTESSRGFVATSLDGGNLGPQRKLYIREIVARFGHNLALNWNLGEENTQTPEQQKAMIEYIRLIDP